MLCQRVDLRFHLAIPAILFFQYVHVLTLITNAPIYEIGELQYT